MSNAAPPPVQTSPFDAGTPASGAPDGREPYGPVHPGGGRSPARKVLVIVGAVLGAVLVVQAGTTLIDLMLSETTTRQHTYSPRATVELVADGDVTVAVGNAAVVDVAAAARSGLRSPRFSAEETGDRLVVTHRCGITLFGGSVCQGSLDVTLPAATDVVVRTSNGDVVASGLAGDLDLQSSNGRIDTTDITGNVTARTSNGPISVRDVTGDALLHSSNGSIEAARTGGSLEAHTSNGRLTVTGVGGDARVTGSNGHVDVEQVDGNVFARTTNGAVQVRGTGEPVRLTIGTSNGRQTIEGATDPAATRTVEIRSSNGDVSYLAP